MLSSTNLHKTNYITKKLISTFCMDRPYLERGLLGYGTHGVMTQKTTTNSSAVIT